MKIKLRDLLNRFGGVQNINNFPEPFRTNIARVLYTHYIVGLPSANTWRPFHVERLNESMLNQEYEFPDTIAQQYGFTGAPAVQREITTGTIYPRVNLGIPNPEQAQPGNLDDLINRLIEQNPVRPNETNRQYRQRIQAMDPRITLDALRGWYERRQQQQPPQQQAQQIPNLMDQPNPQGGPAPMQAQQQQQMQDNEDLYPANPANVPPQTGPDRIDTLRRILRYNPRAGQDETLQQWANRAQPGIIDRARALANPELRDALNAWNQLPADQQRVTADDIQQVYNRYGELPMGGFFNEGDPNQPRENPPAPAPQPPRGGPQGTQPGNVPPPVPPQPQGVQPIDPRQQFLLDRMSTLMGQIRRTGRRATPTELEQVQGLYNQLGPITDAVRPQLERIARDFGEQAMLLNVPALGEAQQQRQAIQQFFGDIGGNPNVPMRIAGNMRSIDYETIAAQYPQLFQSRNNQLVRDGNGNPILKKEDAVDRRDMPIYRKIRSDINYVLNRTGMGGNLEGLGRTNPARERRTYQQLVDEFNQQDALYRASNEYRNTRIPEGPITRAVNQMVAQVTGIPQENVEQDMPFVTPTIGQQNTMQPQVQPQAQPQQQVQTGTIYPRVNVAATGGQGAQQAATAPGNAPALGEPLQGQPVGRQYGRVGQMLLGQNAQLLTVPQYTPWQRDIFRELGTMGIESLRQAYQPLFTPERQQVAANQAVQSILQRLQNGDQDGARQELLLAGGLGNLMALQQGQGLPINVAGQPQTPAQTVVNQPGPQGFVLPNMPLPQQPQNVGGLAGLARQAAALGQAYQQAGGGLRGVLNAIQQGANVIGQGANTVGQAAQIPANVQQAYNQQGGGILGGIAAVQQAAQGIGNLGRQQPGWEYGPGYGMQYPHPMPFTAANELNRFYGQTVPTLAERFTAAGGGAQRSSAFRGALGSAGRDLGVGLAALGEQQQLAQNAQQLQTQQAAFNQQMAQREFAENQRRYAQQQQQANQLFAYNRGAGMLNTALQPQTQQALLPGGQGILPIALNATAQAGMGALRAASMFA